MSKEDKIWMARVIKELKPGDIVVLTEGTPAYSASGHYLSMARSLGDSINKHVSGVTVVALTRGNSLERLGSVDRENLVEQWVKTSTLTEDFELREAAKHLLHLMAKKKLSNALME
jgi:hypothetical protein